MEKPQKPTLQFKITNSSSETKKFDLFSFNSSFKGILSSKQEDLEITCDDEKYYWELISKIRSEYIEIYLIELLSTNEKQISESIIYKVYDDSMMVGVTPLKPTPLNVYDSKNKKTLNEIFTISMAHSIKTKIEPHTHLIMNIYLREAIITIKYKNL